MHALDPARTTRTARASVFALVLFAVLASTASGSAQDHAGIEEVVIAWDAGDVTLARQLAVRARERASSDETTRLVYTAVHLDLDPRTVLALDVPRRRDAVAELDAIDDQGTLTAGLAVAGGATAVGALLLGALVPSLVEPGCSHACTATEQLRVAAVVSGGVTLVAYGVAIGLLVDLLARLGRWADTQRQLAAPRSLSFAF